MMHEYIKKATTLLSTLSELHLCQVLVCTSADGDAKHAPTTSLLYSFGVFLTALWRHGCIQLGISTAPAHWNSRRNWEYWCGRRFGKRLGMPLLRVEHHSAETPPRVPEMWASQNATWQAWQVGVVENSGVPQRLVELSYVRVPMEWKFRLPADVLDAAAVAAEAPEKP